MIQSLANTCQYYFLNDERKDVEMGLFSRKIRTINLFAPVSGDLIAIEKVDDEVFSSKALGEGFAIKPTNGDVYSPIEGTVTSVFPTKHAISLKTKDKLEVLVHLGIDTVELNGKGFETFVQEGDTVTESTKLVNVDLDYLVKEKKASDVMVIFTNLDQRKLVYNEGSVAQGDSVGHIE